MQRRDADLSRCFHLIEDPEQPVDSAVTRLRLDPQEHVSGDQGRSWRRAQLSAKQSGKDKPGRCFRTFWA